MEPIPPGQNSRSNDVAALRKKKALNRLIMIAVAILVLGGGYWYFERSSSLSLEHVLSLGNSVENSIVSEVGKNFSAPPPLRAPSGTSTPPTQSSALTRVGVIVQTNLQRKENGALPALSENATLDGIASLRLADMFKKQYFAHVAPDGASAETVAKSVGYTYLAIGENLALGNFGGDKGVVDAWMGSPGHRANILETHYTEIGVAVGRGVFEGETTWIAVQVFGRPASDCPSPDAGLKANIDVLETRLSQMEADLRAKRSVMDGMQPKYGPAYNQQVDGYNAEADQYNQLITETKSQVAQYNAEVVAFNQCI